MVLESTNNETTKAMSEPEKYTFDQVDYFAALSAIMTKHGSIEDLRAVMKNDPEPDHAKMIAYLKERGRLILRIGQSNRQANDSGVPAAAGGTKSTNQPCPPLGTTD